MAGAGGQNNPIGFEMMQVGPGQDPAAPPPVGFEGIAQPPPPGLYPQLDPVPTGNGPSTQPPDDGGKGYPGASELNDVKVDTNDEMGERTPLADSMHGLDRDQETKAGKVDIKETLFMNDGKRRIDYVLAYHECHDDKHLERRRERRKIFEENLIEEGLELEKEDKKDSQDGKTYYIKVHATWEVLTRFAELMYMKMPMKIEGEDTENDLDSENISCWDGMPDLFKISEEIVKPDANYYTTAFNRQRYDMFVIKDQETFFTNAQRSRVVHEVLNRTRQTEDKSSVGIRKLIDSGAYTAVYPLHEGPFKSEHSLLTHEADNERHLLYETWARPARWYKFQPLDLIRKYFGEKIGIYFTWLGFYTTMLIPSSLVGVICFIYGCATVLGNTPSNEICDRDISGNLTMCPLCDKRCNYWQLVDSCFYSQLTYLFDNVVTVFFAVFMAVWATMFLEFWKRKEKEIQYDWDVAEFEEEEETIRPEYESSVRHKKLNPVTQTLEPYMPPYLRAPRACSAFVVILFMICLVVAAVFAVIIYRVIIVAVLYASGDDVIKRFAKIVTTVTAALLSLIIIMLLNKVYEKIAIALTNFENPRTETEFDDKFTFKMFCFQFVNYYATIFYIAFFKGRFNGRPGDFDYQLGYRGEECDPAGCLIELCIQLGIVMIGKQAINNAKEIIIPVALNWLRARKAKKAEKEEKNVYTRWEQDYDLGNMPDLGLFDEYLEMVVQFGFVTIFVAAFPLAPLFALINNIIEIRLDAYKFVSQWKRPLAKRAQDIGSWFAILKGISYLSVLTNAFIIAYTSDFVPKQVYKYVYSPNGTLAGYIDNSLSIFNVSDFQNQSIPENPTGFEQVTECRYRDYREPPTDPYKYNFTMQYWHVFAARLAFVIVFEHLVILLKQVINWLVPDTPGNVKEQMLREKYLTRQALYDAEYLKAKELRNRKASAGVDSSL